MQPSSIIDEDPELVLIQAAQIGHDRHEHLLHAFLQKSAAQVVVVDDEVAIFGTKEHGDHVPPEVLRRLLVACLTALSPASPLGFDLAHTDRDLRRAQLFDGNCRQDGSSNWLHCVLPRKRICRVAERACKIHCVKLKTHTTSMARSAPVSRFCTNRQGPRDMPVPISGSVKSACSRSPFSSSDFRTHPNRPE